MAASSLPDNTTTALLDGPELAGGLGLGNELVVEGDGGLVLGEELLLGGLILLVTVALVDDTLAAKEADGGVVDISQGLADVLGADEAALVLETAKPMMSVRVVAEEDTSGGHGTYSARNLTSMDLRAALVKRPWAL